MSNYYEANSRNFAFHRDNSRPRISEKVHQQIRDFWAAATIDNPTLYDWEIYCAHRVADDDKTLRIFVNRSQFSTYYWARETGNKLKGYYAMRTRIFGFDQLHTKALKPGKTGEVTGILPYKEMDMRFFLGFVQYQTISEARQRYHQETESLLSIAFLGLYIDYQTLSVDFTFKANSDTCNQIS